MENKKEPIPKMDEPKLKGEQAKESREQTEPEFKTIEEAFASDPENAKRLELIPVPKEGEGLVLIRSKEVPTVALLAFSRHEYKDADEPAYIDIPGVAKNGQREKLRFHLAKQCSDSAIIAGLEGPSGRPDYLDKYKYDQWLEKRNQWIKEEWKKFTPSFIKTLAENGIKVVGMGGCDSGSHFRDYCKMEGVEYVPLWSTDERAGEFSRARAEKIVTEAEKRIRVGETRAKVEVINKVIREKKAEIEAIEKTIREKEEEINKLQNKS